MSMVEVVIAVAISALTFVFLVQSNETFQRTLKLYGDVSRLVNELPSLRKELKKFFARTVAMSTAASGTVRAGMEIDGNGAIFLAADLRQCSELDPGTSLDVANLTEVRILCCTQNLSLNVNFPTPLYPAGTTESFNSACTNTPGLSVQLVKGGNILRNVCFPEFDEFYMQQAGIHRVRNRPLFLMDWVANFSKTGKNETIKIQRFQLYDSIGGLDQLTVECN
jgi:hypothetical protein